MNSDGVLLSYTEFLDKFKIPIRPREYTIVMDALPSKVLCLLKNDCNENVSGYSHNPCSLNRERDAALNASGTPTA